VKYQLFKLNTLNKSDVMDIFALSIYCEHAVILVPPPK